ncbi:hypothetical protein GCM10009850_091100 [Nonomuraea monospora]|uniref:Uncharacterized protein n=1 Tax=Nonomuraea monospora TaxID=568818 RepID=A0ABP5PPP3_9ACTN
MTVLTWERLLQFPRAEVRAVQQEIAVHPYRDPASGGEKAGVANKPDQNMNPEAAQ